MGLPINTIILWSGAIVDIPAGFVLCNGANGTPDLRDRFVFGAGISTVPGDTGGAINHGHDFTGDGHSHKLDAGALIGAGAVFDDDFTSENATGTTDDSDGRPPFHSLAFIMYTG